jgi:hypothetical protein
MWGKLALAGAALLVLRRVAFGYPRPEQRFRVLFRGEAAVIDAAALAMYPRGGAIDASGHDADIARYVDRLMQASVPRIRWLIHLLIFFIEHSTLVFRAPGHRGFRRFSALPHPQQVAVLDAWATSPLFFRRLVFTSLRSLCTLGYFAHPAVLEQLRIAPLAMGPRVCEADLLYPPIGRGRDAIRWRAGDVNAPTDVVEPLDPDGPMHPLSERGAL